jgi:BA14K-like protein
MFSKESVMNRIAKTAVAALAGFAAVAATMAPAQADHWRRHHNDDALAAGLIGLAAGAIIVGALSEPSPRVIYEQPRVIYHPRPRPVTVYDYPPAPRRHYEPEVITYDDGVEPWSREWFRYCSNRYRSFNPETGTYRGYDGRSHFCAGN